MKQLLTQGIILTRIDYGEADRILTLLTPDYGKLHLLAKGVRRVKSKLAGGIELFSVSHVSFIQGRGDLGTLVSTRLVKHYGQIVTNIERTMLGYELIRQLNKLTEDAAEAEYFALLEQAFVALDDPGVDAGLIRTWFAAQLLRLSGHTPNLQQDTGGDKLIPTARYEFSYDANRFAAHASGSFGANDIKFLRLLFSGNQPKILNQVQASASLSEAAWPLVQTLRQASLGL